MRALVVNQFGPVEHLAPGELPDPVAAPGQVVVDIRATAVNFVDTLVVTGKYQFLPERPFAPGKLPCGTISQVGDGVTRFKLGDRVLTLSEQGGFAQRVAVAAKDCFVLPDTLSFTDAAAMSLAYDTAWFALCERGRAKPGETLLVLGATGGVGAAAVQLGKAYGLRVLAGVSSPARTEQALALGADGIVDLSRPDLIDSLREQVRAQTGGAGADIVIDPLGDAIFDAAIRAVAWRGRVVVVGFAAGRIPALKVNYVMLKNMEVSGLQVSDYRKRAPEEMAHCLREIFRLHDEGKLQAMPVTTCTMAQVPDALRQLQQRTARNRLVMLNEE